MEQPPAWVSSLFSWIFCVFAYVFAFMWLWLTSLIARYLRDINGRWDYRGIQDLLLGRHKGETATLLFLAFWIILGGSIVLLVTLMASEMEQY